MYSNPYQWKRIRNRVLVGEESIRAVARDEGIARNTVRKMLAHDRPLAYGGRELPGPSDHRRSNASLVGRSERGRVLWMEWLYDLERGAAGDETLERELAGRGAMDRKRILSVLAHRRGFTTSAIERHLGLSRNTIRQNLEKFAGGGIDALLGRKPRSLKADDEGLTRALFGLLHEPPSLSGFNRATWRMDDLQRTLVGKGVPVCKDVIRQAVRKAGYKWRSAKVVLTSTDPAYREKLEHVQSVLANLSADERFFSIDEYGPFSVKAKPGRVLVAPGEHPSVPQWQKSKGWLIATAALELSRNQVTHFYSRAKNTTEMIKMAGKLLEDYSDARTLYLSWDAASWHMSKELLAFVDVHNANVSAGPRIQLVPLPASAQFLNVIESVFSGMARAIIHNSDYPSVRAATEAIDRYFAERNRHYQENPMRAGRKIWGKERTAAEFSTANNCKDPAYR